MALTEEQEAKLAEIDAGEGKKLKPAQKAIVLQWGMKPISVTTEALGKATKLREHQLPQPIKTDESGVKLIKTEESGVKLKGSE